jgi:hypothetical protein
MARSASCSYRTADVSARDAAIVFSFAAQHGADLDALRKAISRDAQGRPSGPLGAALDRLAAERVTDERDSGAGR